MSASLTQFFNIFWEKKACRSLFLLHSEELLESQIIEIDGVERVVFRPRIIISNNFKTGTTNQELALNAENVKLRVKEFFNNKGEILYPKIEKFIEDKFGKSLKTLQSDLNQKTKLIPILFKVVRSIRNEKKREEIVIGLLQEYGFIGKNITSFVKLGNYIETYLRNNIKHIISEENVFHFFDILELARFYYYVEMYKGMLKSNRILVDALHDNEHYEDRLDVLSLMQDSGILFAGVNETYFQCLNCKPGTAYGSMLLDIRVKNLNKFKCPVCSTPFVYLSPLLIHEDIYNKIISKDGLLLYAIGDILEKNNYNRIEYNKIISPNIEIDIYVTNEGNPSFAIEVKMFKLHLPENRLIQKVNRSISKIKRHINTLKENNLYNGEKYFLVTNIMNEEILNKTSSNLSNDLDLYNIEIHSIDSFKSYLSPI